jgi:hypothetical protein
VGRAVAAARGRKASDFLLFRLENNEDTWHGELIFMFDWTDFD